MSATAQTQVGGLGTMVVLLNSAGSPDTLSAAALCAAEAAEQRIERGFQPGFATRLGGRSAAARSSPVSASGVPVLRRSRAAPGRGCHIIVTGRRGSASLQEVCGAAAGLAGPGSFVGGWGWSCCRGSRAPPGARLQSGPAALFACGTAAAAGAVDQRNSGDAA